MRWINSTVAFVYSTGGINDSRRSYKCQTMQTNVPVLKQENSIQTNAHRWLKRRGRTTRAIIDGGMCIASYSHEWRGTIAYNKQCGQFPGPYFRFSEFHPLAWRAKSLANRRFVSTTLPASRKLGIFEGFQA